LAIEAAGWIGGKRRLRGSNSSFLISTMGFDEGGLGVRREVRIAELEVRE
jgi:hypothetical protein